MSDTMVLEAAVSGYLLDPSTADAHQLFHELRAAAPVYWSPTLRTWLVTSFEAAGEVFRNPELSRELAGKSQFSPLIVGADEETRAAVDMYSSALLWRDPPDHTRLRRLISGVFTPKAITAWRPRVEAIAADLADRLEGRDEFDFLTEFAYPLPERVICELVGVPYEDHDVWTEWNAAMTHRAVYLPSDTPEQKELSLRRSGAQEALRNFASYFDDLLRRRPAGHDNLLIRLSEVEAEGDRLSRDELIGTMVLLVVAGHHTTANLLGNGMLGFLRHPDQLELLRRRPDLTVNATEEMLRYETPARSQPRIASAPTTIGGQEIAEGESVLVVIDAANRDPARFTDPDRVDITRTDASHIAFGVGMHFCVGAALARLEGSIGFATVATRLGMLELAEERIEWKPTFGRGLRSLRVRKINLDAPQVRG